MDELVAALTTSLSAANSGTDTEGLRELVSSTLARAARFAPCLRAGTLGADDLDVARAILRDVVQRRLDLRGARVVPGIVTSKGMGGRTLTVDGKGVAVALFQPDEIAELQSLCSSSESAAPVGGGLPVGSFPPAPRWPC